MNPKTRVFELAKELHLTSKELVGELQKMRIQVKSHMSVLEDETVAYIKRHWGEDEIVDDTVVPGMTVAPPEEKSKPQEPTIEVVKKAQETQEAPTELESEAAASVEPVPEAPTVREKRRPEELALEAVRQEAEAAATAAPAVKPVQVKESTPPKKPEPDPKPPKVSEEPQQPAPVARELPTLKVNESATVGEVADRLNVKPAEVIKKLISLGVFATINQRLDQDVLEILLNEYGYALELQEMYGEDLLDQNEEPDKPEDLKARPPVVTIMGHVNHGKTSLLDAIRETNVIEGEAGGITQHIGAYQVMLPNRGEVTFLDTPGHEAFTTLRARGAQVTDVVVLVVAADDGVQPQTVEAIDHAKAAGVPIIVAVNKIDKPGANPDQVKQELSHYQLISEEWGGKTIFVEISAKKKIGIDKLLEMILLEAEMLELKANPSSRAKGTVIEAKLDRGRGTVVTALIERGTIKVGDPIVVGVQYGRVRALNNDRGQAVKNAGPGTPVELLGMSGMPSAGDILQGVESDKLARQVAMKRQMIKREQELKKGNKITLDNLNNQIAEGAVKELKIIIKADVQGSAEVLKESLEGLSTEKVKLTCIHSAVGNIRESDIMLAAASNAILLGFNVTPESGVDQAAKREDVDVRIYKVIYEMVEDVKAAMTGLLEPHYHEVPLGKAEVKTLFKLSSGHFIAGSQVTTGKVLRNAHGKVVRQGEIIHQGKIESLRRFKEDVKEVGVGMECGITLTGFKDFEPGDIIEAFELEAVAQKL